MSKFLFPSFNLILATVFAVLCFVAPGFLSPVYHLLAGFGWVLVALSSAERLSKFLIAKSIAKSMGEKWRAVGVDRMTTLLDLSLELDHMSERKAKISKQF